MTYVIIENVQGFDVYLCSLIGRNPDKIYKAGSDVFGGTDSICFDSF